jgi:uncharacterized OB-fold protein
VCGTLTSPCQAHCAMCGNQVESESQQELSTKKGLT